MGKRLLDATASELSGWTKRELLESIAGCEGRVLAGECIGVTPPLLTDVTNAEAVAAMGADILLLNLFDVEDPVICGLPPVPKGETVREIKRLTGRIVGINLEPAGEMADRQEEVWKMSGGRAATAANARKAAEMGVDLVLLTGNPGNGVENGAIVRALREIREAAGDRLILAAGKMHASGILSEGAEKILTEEDIRLFREAGADIILMPAPGTVPGMTLERVRELVEYSHGLGALTITAIGTSQEGSDEATIRQIALMCKMAGTDIHHIGDSGYVGMALPENIMAYSVAIRGVRHTYRQMAKSVNR
ncbi:MAG TPA: haloacid dehalogenase-like hydrolase [Candidatus Eisenbergiella merdigallinarum]|uniref:Haloacid dehalogenase-like hydrolase n=1 Tax=Candidatus Eisenbergiella merdigallinarum TaxID=2838552 RepID=A0A9D2MR40_9FIRM|nr:haloacid dehalogenase-like hydrolase [Candidatus Eisenbergiella merdigallinarum]